MRVRGFYPWWTDRPITLPLLPSCDEVADNVGDGMGFGSGMPGGPSGGSTDGVTASSGQVALHSPGRRVLRLGNPFQDRARAL